MPLTWYLDCSHCTSLWIVKVSLSTYYLKYFVWELEFTSRWMALDGSWASDGRHQTKKYFYFHKALHSKNNKALRQIGITCVKLWYLFILQPNLYHTDNHWLLGGRKSVWFQFAKWMPWLKLLGHVHFKYRHTCVIHKNSTCTWYCAIYSRLQLATLPLYLQLHWSCYTVSCHSKQTQSVAARKTVEWQTKELATSHYCQIIEILNWTHNTIHNGAMNPLAVQYY